MFFKTYYIRFIQVYSLIRQNTKWAMPDYSIVTTVVAEYYKNLDKFFKSFLKPTYENIKEQKAIVEELMDSITYIKNYKTACNYIFYDICGIADEDGDDDDYIDYMSLDKTHHWWMTLNSLIVQDTEVIHFNC